MFRKKVDIKSFKKVYLVHNHNAGKQTFFAAMHRSVERLADEFIAMYGPAAFSYYRINTFNDAQIVARKACDEQVDWIIIAGGDGTLRAISEVLVERDYMPYVSIYPAGTVNLVAKELAQKTDATSWLMRVEKGITAPVWLGKANDRIFLTVAGIGVDSLVVDMVTPKEKKLLSTLAYVRQSGLVAGNEMLLHPWKYKFEVMIDGDGVWRPVPLSSQRAVTMQAVSLLLTGAPYPILHYMSSYLKRTVVSTSCATQRSLRPICSPWINRSKSVRPRRSRFAAT